MVTYYLDICNKNIKVESVCGDFRAFCKGYEIKQPNRIDYTFSVRQEDIDEQARISHFSNKGRLEGFVVLNKLAGKLLFDDNALFIHGAVVSYNGGAFMFTAPSGTGKTTHIKLWIENLKDAYILNGDKPFITVHDNVLAWGSPWCGTENYGVNKSEKLKAICFINRADKNSINEISFEEALPLLINQTAILKVKNGLMQTMKLLCMLKNKIKFYSFDIDSGNYGVEAFNTSYEVLKNI